MAHHKVALITIAVAVVLDAALGVAFAGTEHIAVWHGLFCALANAVTDGGDIPPRTHAGYAITAAEYALVVPLFAATFSLFTSALANVHIRKSEARIKQHVSGEHEATREATCGGNGASTVA